MAWSRLAAVDKEGRGQMWDVFQALVVEVMGVGHGQGRGGIEDG